jgi:hypothetical protein
MEKRPMTSPNRHAGPNETPLEEGLRRYAPRDAARRVAIADFIVALLLPRPRGRDPAR